MSHFSFEEYTNDYANPFWAQEYRHPYVATGFAVIGTDSGSRATIQLDTYVKSIDFKQGLTTDDVLLTNDGFGNLSVTVLNAGSVVDSYVIPYFEDGKTITGFAIEDPIFGGFSSFESEGDYTVEQDISGGATGYIITAQGDVHFFEQDIRVTYFLESMSFANGTFDLYHGVTMMHGTNEGNSIAGFGVNDTTGQLYHDKINGWGGDDYLYGYEGNDTLEGDEGADYLNAGLNDDTYVWAVGDGNDYIVEEGGLDKIVLDGVLPADVRFERSSGVGYDLIVHIGDESVTVGGQFYSYAFADSSYDTYQVESLVYGDSTEVSLLHNLTFTGTGDSETIQGVGDDNTLLGLGGDDYLYGYEGNDTLEGDEGADYLNGGLNDDTYVWAVGDGNDYIVEEGGLDKIVLDGVLPADVRFEYDGSYNLIVHINTENITVSGQFYSYALGDPASYDGYQVENLVYGDGTEISLLHNLTFTGTDEVETIQGVGDDNILLGLGGDDYLYGYEGNDTLKGGEGADYLVGDTGVDLFVLDNLNGVDTIADYEAGEKIDVSAIFLGAPGFYPALAFSAGFLRLEDLGSQTNIYVDIDGAAGGNPEQLLAQVYGLDINTLGIEDFILPEVSNTNPVAQDDSFTGLEDIPVTGNLLADNGFGVDSDLDGDTLSVLPETITTFRGALVTLNADGTFLYTPLPNAYGNDKFNYTLLDGHGGFDSGKAIITLTNVIKPVVALSLDGGDDNSNLIGTYLNDTLHGNGGDDVLFGLSGADKLYGGDGEDILYGGKSSDLLSGGAHADTFILDGITNRVDTITDFNVAEGDHLQVRDILSFDPLVDAISDFIHITQTGANSILSVDADGALNGENFVNVARLNGVTGLDVNQLFADGDIVIQQQIV